MHGSEARKQKQNIHENEAGWSYEVGEWDLWRHQSEAETLPKFTEQNKEYTWKRDYCKGSMEVRIRGQWKYIEARLKVQSTFKREVLYTHALVN